MNVTSKPSYDRAVEDLGNIVNIGHVNFRVPDQGLATAFYMTGLGLTRDEQRRGGDDLCGPIADHAAEKAGDRRGEQRHEDDELDG